ncbi:MAG: amidohydrolase family protein [Gemmatimonadales bacterium]
MTGVSVCRQGAAVVGRLLATLLLSFACTTAALGQAAYEVVLLNGRIIDGTGASWYLGDLAIQDGRIARVTPAGVLRGATARRTIDATGMVVAPGFIDIQSHSRGSLLAGDGRVVSKITQGITTEILGEGWSNAPLNPANGSSFAEDSPTALRAAFAEPHGFAHWLEAMERHGNSVNVGSFLGATTVRLYAKGMGAGAPTPAEMDTMRAVVRRAMADGAFGLASALIYPPAAFATTEELTELARAMRPYGGLYVSHIRSEGDHLVESVDEAIRIGREAGVPVEIYHLKAMGSRNWAKIPAVIRQIDSARANGVDVQANMYPYIATGTAWTACVPPWASTDGKLLSNLRDPATRTKIRDEMMKDRTEWENNCALSGAEGMLIVATTQPANQRYAGKRLSEIAAMMERSWADALLDLIVAEERVGGAIYYMMSEENIERQLAAPWMKFGTDAPGLDPERASGLTHPRAYGSFPRILGYYVRERGALSLEEAVRKLSSAVTTRLGIDDRGVLRAGLAADLVVFDPATVLDRATFERPHRTSVGIRDVFVNGEPVVLDGVVTGAKPGKALRGSGARPF